VLVITRRAGEGVYIGNDVFIKVISIRGSQVRFGFDAPKSIVIMREEMKEGFVKDRDSGKAKIAGT